MTTHVANVTLQHAQPVRVDERSARAGVPAPVPEVKTVNAGERFHPADLGLTEDQTAALLARGQIREATDKDPPVAAPAPMKVTGNETEGSGATRRGTSQQGPAGIDSAAAKQ